MAQVSARVTRILLETLALRDVAPETVVSGLPVGLDELRDVRAHLPWNVFVDFLDNVERAVGGPDGLEALGEATVRVPSWAFFRTAARYAFTTRQLHELGRRYVAPTLFPDLPIDILEATDQRMIVRGALPATFRSCPAFFHVCKGALRALSTVLGLPPSLVQGSIGSRAATFEIIMPHDPRRGRLLLQRVRAWIVGASIDDFLAQQDAVNESYEMLLRSRQEFRDLLEHAPMGAAIYRDGRYVWVNTALARALGWERPADLVGRAVIDDVHPDHREAAVRVIDEPAGKQVGTLRLLRRDSGVVVYRLAASQDVVFQGRPARLVVGSDVTERTRAREQLAVADRMAAVGMLAAGVAHEINNPLTYVQLNVQVLARGLERMGASAELQASASTALEGMERVRSIVADLRTFARADEDAIGPVDVNDVIETTVRLAQKTIGASSQLDVALADVPAVRANRGRLGQVVLNILLNAHEAVEERGGSGVVRVRSFREPGGAVAIEIADSGAGMPPETLRRVFEPFFTTKAVGRGTGLGLPICHRIVTSYGGDIVVESSPSTPGPRALRTFVRVTLPSADRAAEPSQPRIAAPRANRRRRILVVDDEPSVGMAVRNALGDEHDVDVVTGGAAALDRLRATDGYDLVLCDIMMPDVDGIAVFERVRESAPHVAQRFVFMSGGAFTPRARAFLASCENPRFEKPFSVDQLLAIAARA